jgi:hypothetical protein
VARERDLSTLLEFYTPDIETHDAPECRDQEEQIFPSGDLVFALWRAKASGKQGTRLDSLAISVFELRAERVVPGVRARRCA